jgi:hypothetical protein
MTTLQVATSCTIHIPQLSKKSEAVTIEQEGMGCIGRRSFKVAKRSFICFDISNLGLAGVKNGREKLK